MPRDMSSKRYARLASIMAVLQSRKEVSRQELESVGEYTIAEGKGEYSQNRTLQNDLDFLRDQGAEIVYDRHKKKYILKEVGAFQINLKITRGEIEALSAGLKMAAHFLPHLEQKADSLWEKLGTYIPKDMTDRGADLAHSTVMAIPVGAVNAEVFSTLIEAKYRRSAVNIRYSSPGKSSRQWVLSPYDVYFRGNAWYMISYNHKHKALSTHRISRIISASLSGEPYVLPGDGGFTEDYVATAWHIAPGTERHPIKVHITGRLAESMTELQWHPTQQIKKQSDGSIILTAEVPYLDEVARWVLAGAPSVHVLEPEELKTLIRDFAKQVIDEA